MLVEVSHDSRIRIDGEFSERLSATLQTTLARFADRITRIECHLADTNASKGGAKDKRCMFEARLNGLQPIAVSHEAETLPLAIDGAMEKLQHAIGHRLGKLSTH
jgi:ribosome-associated translation inhibitor RaiA